VFSELNVKLLIASVLFFFLIPTKLGLAESSLLKVDEREIKLDKFFDRYKCPQPNYAQEYIQEADRYNIPYTLLPAISIQESTCGRHYRFDNYWGWNSARTGFSTVAQGIDFVSSQLALGRYYKDKTIKAKLQTYNPNPSYAPKVIQLMTQIENE